MPEMFTITSFDGKHRIRLMISENSDKNTTIRKISTFNMTCTKTSLITLLISVDKYGRITWNFEKYEPAQIDKREFVMYPVNLVEIPTSISEISAETINIKISSVNINVSRKLLAITDNLDKVHHFDVEKPSFSDFLPLTVEMQAFAKLVNIQYETFQKTKPILAKMFLPENVSTFHLSPSDVVTDLFLRKDGEFSENTNFFMSSTRDVARFDRCNNEEVIHLTKLGVDFTSSSLVVHQENKWYFRSYSKTAQQEHKRAIDNYQNTLEKSCFSSSINPTPHYLLHYNLTELKNAKWKVENGRLLCTLIFNNNKQLKIKQSLWQKNFKKNMMLHDGHQIQLTPYRIWIYRTMNVSTVLPLRNYLILANKFSSFSQILSSKNDLVIFVLGRQLYGATFNQKPKTVYYQGETIVKTNPNMHNRIYNTYGNLTVSIDAYCSFSGSTNNFKFRCKLKNVTIVQLRLQNKLNVVSLRDLCSKVKHNKHEIKIVLKRTAKSTACLEIYNIVSVIKPFLTIDHVGTIFIENYHLCDVWIIELESHMRINMTEEEFGLQPWQYRVSNNAENMVLMPENSVRPLHFKVLRAESLKNVTYYRIEKSLVVEPQFKSKTTEMKGDFPENTRDRILILFYQFFENVFAFPLVLLEFSDWIVKVVKSTPISIS